VETGEALGTMDHEFGIRADLAGPSFSPDGTLLAVATGARKATVWDTRTRTVVVELSGHSKGIRSVAFHPAGQLIATGSADRTIRMWRISPPDYRG
jgi:WD40 repeat protein